MKKTLDTKERISLVSRGTLDFGAPYAILGTPDTTNMMPRAPNPTEDRFNLIAQGMLDPERASQLLGEMFNAQDYLTVLRDYPRAQQYIDGLDKVYSYCFCK